MKVPNFTKHKYSFSMIIIERFQNLFLILGNKTDPCVFSSQLITCLADKGKSNCGDWPVGELPFTNLPSE